MLPSMRQADSRSSSVTSRLAPFGAATRQNYLTHWTEDAWSHTGLSGFNAQPVALEHTEGGKPLVIAQGINHVEYS